MGKSKEQFEEFREEEENMNSSKKHDEFIRKQTIDNLIDYLSFHSIILKKKFTNEEVDINLLREDVLDYFDD